METRAACVAVRLQARVCEPSLQLVGCTSALVCDVQRCSSCSCRLWRYIRAMPVKFYHRIKTCGIELLEFAVLLITCLM